MNQVGGNVLIVDGDQPSRQVMAQMLNKKLPGVTVDWVAHAHDAINHASKVRYDLWNKLGHDQKMIQSWAAGKEKQ